MLRHSTIVRAGRSFATVLAASLLALASGSAPGSLSLLHTPALAATLPGAVGEDDLERDLERIRKVTKPFHDIAAAHAAGYPTAVPQCVESPAGGMGHHYMHPDLLDDTLVVEKPEILVYAPTRDRKLKLAGVEYIVPYSAWQRQEAPRILGQALKRSDDLKIWYLHVWVWEKNANGVFADWNPAVRCSP